jgi:hypothetical protein
LSDISLSRRPRRYPAASNGPDAVTFRGETITIQIGYGPGGGYDTYGRALARHYGRFIPGNPTVVPKEHAGRRLIARRQPRLQSHRP